MCPTIIHVFSPVYSVSFISIKLWLIINYEDEFMKVEFDIALNFELCVNTHKKTHERTVRKPI